MKNKLKKLFSYRELEAAWLDVKTKQAAGGIDKHSVRDFEADQDRNLRRLLRKLNNRTYLPEAYLQIKIKKNKNEKRILALATINDKIVQTAIKNRIESRLETTFFDSSYAYREGRNARKAVNKVRHYIQAGKNEWVAKCDIDNFFDTIPHKRLRKQLSPYVTDKYLMELIFSFVKMGYVTQDKQWIERTGGVPQGAVLSPLLANLYLSPLDQRMNDLNIPYVRYADDFVMLAPTEEQARQILDSTVDYIQNRLQLKLNPGAFVKHTQYGFKFLGVWITDKSVTLPSTKIEKIKAKIRKAFRHANFPKKYHKVANGINAYYARIVPQHILFPVDELIIRLWTNKLINDNKITRKKHIKAALRELRFVTDIYNQNLDFHIRNIQNEVYEQKNARKITSAEQAVKLRRKIYERKAAANAYLHIEGYGIVLGVAKNHIRIKEQGNKIRKFPLANLKQITIASKATSVSTALIKYCADHNIAIDFVRPDGTAYAKLYHYQSTHNRLWLAQMQHTRSKHAAAIARRLAAAKINNQLKTIRYFSKYARKTDTDIAQLLPGLIDELQQIRLQIKSLPPGDNLRDSLMGYEGTASARYWQWFELMVDEETDFKERITRGATDLVNQMLNYGYAILYRLVRDSVIHQGLHPELGYLHAYQKNKDTLVFDLVEPFRQPVVDRAVLAMINRGTTLKTHKGLLDEPTRRKLITAVYKRLGQHDKYLGQRLTFYDIIHKQTHLLKLHITGQAAEFKPYKITKW